MYGKLGIVLLFIFGPLPAQEDLENLLALDKPESENYRVYEELLSEQEKACASLDLNSASPSILEASGLFSPFQLYNFVNYREHFGPLFSYYELLILPGFSDNDLAQLKSHSYLSTQAQVRQMVPARARVLFRLSRRFPLASGYIASDSLEPAYAGDPWKSMLQFRSAAGNYLDLGICYEKDAGENWGRLHSLHLQAYLRYKGKGLVQEILAGNYRLHCGLGLIHGTSFLQAPGSMNIHHGKLMRLLPSASSSEYGSSRGVALAFRPGPLEIISWFSASAFDLSMQRFTAYSPESWWGHRLQSGLYRTAIERAGQGLGFCYHTGLQVQVQGKHLTAGTVLAAQWTGASRKAIKQTATEVPLNARPLGSIYMNYIRNRLQIYSELALSRDQGLKHALLTGMEYHFSSFIRTSLILHSFANEFTGLQASAYASKLRTDHQQGLGLQLEIHAGPKLLLKALGEYIHYSSPAWQKPMPTSTLRSRLSLSGADRTTTTWTVECLQRYEEAQSSLQLRFKLEQQLGIHFRCQGKLYLSAANSQLRNPAYASMAELRYDSGEGQHLLIHAVVFRVDNWEDRIYLYEPGFVNTMNFALCYGQAQKILLQLSTPVAKNIQVSLLMNQYRFTRQDVTGSGSEQRKGSGKWECCLQLRYRF